MNSDELLGMLDLGAALADIDAGATDTSAADAGAKRHPTAIVCDEWAMRRGRELADCPGWEATGLDENAAADFHALAFDPQAEFQPCEERTREKFIGAMVETPEFHALHADTMLDDCAAQIAALHFGDQFAEYRRKNDAGKASGGGGKPDGIEGEVAAIGAAGKAIAAAAGEVKELKDAEGALGMGAGSPGGKRDPKAVAEAFNRVRNNPSLRKICEAAGRFRRVAQSKQRMKAVHGFDDVVGVELAGDLARVLPHELAKLDVEELELDMLRRLAERQALCRDFAAVEPVGKGPIIVTLDESGSMRDKIENAKGLALSLAWIARQQKRWCAIVAYSGDSGERVIALPPGRWDEAAVCEWLQEFIGGGSDIDVPIAELPRMYADLKPPAGATDVIMITDAICKLPAALVAKFNAWKLAVRARVLSLILESRPGDLAAVSDECHQVRTLDAGEVAIGRVLSM